MKRAMLWMSLGCALIGCGDFIDLKACDIRDGECRQSVFLAVQRVRGNAWDPWLDMPPARVITGAQFRDELERESNAWEQEGDDHLDAALRMLHLIDPSEPDTHQANIDATVNNVGAYYDPSDKTITVINRGVAGDLDTQTFMLAHELVHAAQDRDIGINQWRQRRTTSENHAASALIEGEATLCSNLVMADIEGFSPLRASFDSYYEAMLDNAREDVFTAASPWYETFGLVYPLGGRYVTSTWLKGGNVAVRALFDDPPNDVVQVFSSPGSSFDREADPFPCAAPSAPAGFRMLRSTAMGALELFGFASRLNLDDAWETASTWRGDRFTLYGNDAGETVVVWQIALGSTTYFTQGAMDLLGVDSVIEADHQARIMQTDSAALADWTDWQACAPL